MSGGIVVSEALIGRDFFGGEMMMIDDVTFVCVLRRVKRGNHNILQMCVCSSLLFPQLF